MSSFQLTNSYFSEGFFLNHQPTIFPLVKLTISVGPKLLSPGLAGPCVEARSDVPHAARSVHRGRLGRGAGAIGSIGWSPGVDQTPRPLGSEWLGMAGFDGGIGKLMKLVVVFMSF